MHYVRHFFEWRALYGICMKWTRLRGSFKLCPHMAPGAIRVNHIPDMALRAFVFFSLSLKSCPMHFLNEDLQNAAVVCLSFWWHIILMLWLTRTILKSESSSYYPDLFQLEKRERIGDIMTVQSHAIYQSLCCELAAWVESAAAVDHQRCFAPNKVIDLSCRAPSFTAPPVKSLWIFYCTHKCQNISADLI